MTARRCQRCRCWWTTDALLVADSYTTTFCPTCIPLVGKPLDQQQLAMIRQMAAGVA